jgi:glyoxylase-like metal-dependent hydrolase (beta-lactamase superfamily II)
MQEIQTGIYIETIYPGVTLGAVLLPGGTIVIDAPMRAEDTRSWRSVLANQGISSNRILVNLDAHADRTLGSRAMECIIIAHQKTALVFRSRPSVFKGQNPDSGAEWETYNDAVGMRWASPEITFYHRICLHWGPPDILLEYHPGPSSGAIWAIIPEQKVVFVGDAVLHNQPPFLANADIPTWLEALEVLKTGYTDYTIISGRGGVVPNEAVNHQYRTLKEILKGMEKFAKQNDPSEITESLIPDVLAELSFPPHLEEQYVQRLRHGLSQYYMRRYRPLDSANQAKAIEGEQ